MINVQWLISYYAGASHIRPYAEKSLQLVSILVYNYYYISIPKHLLQNLSLQNFDR